MRNLNPKIVKRIVSVFVTFLIISFIYLNPLWLLEYRMQDTVFQQPGLPAHNIFIIGIDDHSMKQLGPFHQWSRHLVGEALSILNSGTVPPAVIGIDILYTEQGLIPELDYALLRGLQSYPNVVLSSMLQIGFDPFTFAPTVPTGVSLPFEDLLPYVSHGLINGTLSRDGIARNAFLHVDFEGERYYSFPVEIARKYQGYLPPFVTENAESYITFTGLPGNPGDFFDLSFSDIFEDWFDPYFYAGAIVLIGPYAPGMMDHVPTSINHALPMYGIEIHANTLQMILENNFRTVASPTFVLATLIILLVLVMILGELLDIRIAAAIYGALGLVCHFGAVWVFNNLNYVLPVLMPILVLLFVFLYHTVYGYAVQLMEKSKLRSAFKKYVAPEVVDNLISTGAADSNEVGKRKHIAILFVDVRGFTPLTERLQDSPEQIVEALNKYLELTSQSVFNNKGSVDKFIGDATMALFNGFVPLDDYVYKAVKTGWDMKQGAKEVNRWLSEHLDVKGLELDFGVGIHCGEAIVGNLGPAFRKDYTAIGDAVNTAARLESISKANQVIISDDVYQIVKNRVEVEDLGTLTLRGKTEPMQIYSLVGLKT